MLNAMLQHLFNADVSPVARDIQLNLYVDNIISGSTNEQSAMQYYRKTKQLVSNANFSFLVNSQWLACCLLIFLMHHFYFF